MTFSLSAAMTALLRVPLLALLVLAAGLSKGAEPVSRPTPGSSLQTEEETDFLRYVELEDEEKDALQTAIVTYALPSGITVDLVGAVHIADKAYFQELNRRFRAYDAVLYELVGRPRDLRTKLESGDGSEKLQWLGQMQETLKTALRLESQLLEVDYQAPNFVHADMSVEHFFQSQEEKQETFLSLWLKAIQAQSGMARDRPEPSMLELLMILRQKDPSMDLKRLIGQEFDSMERLITGIEASGGTTLVGERNRHALKVMDREIKAGKKRLAIFYGAAHLPDMEARLLKRGFSKQQQIWLDAWHLPWDEE